MARKTAKSNKEGAVFAAEMEPEMDYIMSPPQMSNVRYRKDLYGNTIIVEDDDEDGDSATSD